MSTSPASTSTPSPSPSPTQTSSPNKGFFSAGGSPALILAFLAIGIFAGGLVSMLFIRRLALRRFFRRSWTREVDNWDTEWTTLLENGGERRSKRRKYLGEKPKLWDIDGSPLSIGKSMRGWQYVTPLSVVLAQKKPPQPLIREPSPIPIVQPRPSRLSSFFRRTRRPAPPSAPPLQPPDYDIPQAVMQVGVAILMPIPQVGHHHGSEEGQVPFYELGFIDFSWNTEYDLTSDCKEKQGQEGSESSV